MEKIREILRLVRERNLYPEVKVIEGGISSEPEFVVDGKKVLSFCSGNYLGLANNDEIKKAINEGFGKHGVHPSGSVLISGTLEVHRELEREIADFIGKDDAIIFNTSTMANMGAIPAVINLPLTSFFSFFRVPFRGTKAAIFSDEFNHATVVEGCRLAKAERIIYEHCNMEDLEKRLKRKRRKKRKLILTDGVFSMDGDVAPLNDIVDLARKYEAMVYVDDAAATGVLGESGRGTMEHLGLKDGVDIVVTTFSKAFGVVGGVAVTSREMVDYLRITARTYIFSGAFSGGLARGVLKALEIIKTDKTRRDRCWENARYLRNELQQAGFNTLNSETPIIPVLIGDENDAINMSKDLFDRGILTPPIRWPAVRHGQARMRFTVTCQYSKAQLDRLVENLTAVSKKYKIV